jgi:hypothetical protein
LRSSSSMLHLISWRHVPITSADWLLMLLKCMNDRLLLNTIWVISQLYHDKNKPHSMRWWYPLCTTPTPIVGYRVMVNMHAVNAADHEFQPWSGQNKDYKIGICCFSAKHAALSSKSNDWLIRKQYNVSEWSSTSIHRLLFQWACTIKIQLWVLV